MIGRIVSAPGKIVVAGEYAVLHGAPAVAMAVNCRAHVAISDEQSESSVLKTTGFADGSRRFHWNGESAEWLAQSPSPEGTALFELVLAEVKFESSTPLLFDLDSGAFSDPATGRKLGFGSSAAIAVALTAACLDSAANPESIFACALRAHRRFQHGRGSGIDIATAVHGGLIRFERDETVLPLDWPDDLHAAILWSGHSASTADKIAGLEQAQPSGAANALADAAYLVCDAWDQGDADEILAALSTFVAQLTSYDASEKLGIFAAGHAAMVDLAKHHPPLVYKPCGAGGGDVGMVFGTSLNDLDAFVAAARGLGFSKLDVALDPSGVSAERLSA